MRNDILIATGKISQINWNLIPINSIEYYILLRKLININNELNQNANISKLYYTFWKYLFKIDMSYVQYCDWDKLKGNNIVDILCDYPELSIYCNWSKLSGDDWQDLIQVHKKFTKLCNWSKLSGHNWNKLLEEQPHLSKQLLKHFDTLDGYDWYILLIEHPEYAKYCDWSFLSDDNLKPMFYNHKILKLLIKI